MGKSWIEQLEPRRLLSAELYANLASEGLQPESLTRFGDRVIFSGVFADAGREPWITDGTAAGTRLVKDLTPGPQGSSVQPFFVAGKYVYLNGAGRLWRSDGTRDGTIPVGVDPGKVPDVTSAPVTSGAVVGRKLFFASNQMGAGALYVADDTGTRLNLLHATYNDGKKSDNWAPSELTGAADKAYFVVSTSSGPQLWQSDGTAAGTSAIRFHAIAISQLTSFNGELYFAAQTATTRGLWKLKNGAKPALLKQCDDLEVFKQNPASSVFWFASEGAKTHKPGQIWRLDAEGLQQVTHLDFDDAVVSGAPVNIGSTGLYFGTGQNELWFCGNADGSAKKVSQFSLFGEVDAMSSIVSTTHDLFIALDDSTRAQLWRIPQAGGTSTLVGDIPTGDTIATTSTAAVFQQEDPGTGESELWAADENATAPAQITHTWGGQNSTGVNNLTPFKNGLLFSTDQVLGGAYFFDYAHSLWFTDGKSAPALIKTIVRHSDKDEFPAPVVFATKNFALFSINNGADAASENFELWTTNGTASGTKRLATGLDEFAFVGQIGSKVLFGWHLDNGTGVAHYALWTSNGTAAGTKHLLDVPDDQAMADEIKLHPGIAFNNKLYFPVDGHLYRSDGSAAGTIEISSKLPATSGWTPAVRSLLIRNDDLLIAGEQYEGAPGDYDSSHASAWSLAADATTATLLVQAPVAQPFYKLVYVPQTGRAWLQTWSAFSDLGQERNLYVIPTTPVSSPQLISLPVPGHPTDFTGYAGGYYFFVSKKRNVSHNYAINASFTKSHLMDDSIPAGDLDPSPVLGDSLIVQGVPGLARIRGTQTAPISTVLPDQISPLHDERQIVMLGDRIFFAGFDDNGESRLWSYALEPAIAGTAFRDMNANGKRDPGEAGVAGLQLFLDINGNSKRDPGEYSVLTSSTGRYEFDDLLPGKYRVVLVLSDSKPSYNAKVLKFTVKTKNFALKTP